MSRHVDLGLTPRERQVALLVNDGLTDREIAETLFITRRTAEWHLKQIFNKLGFNSRAQVAAWVAHDQAVASSGDASGGHRHNLPHQLTRFIGRLNDLDEVQHLLLTNRLVTLTGVGGAGKTRLALEVATRMLDAHPDGPWLVDLTPVKEGRLVARVFGSALGVHERPRQPMASTLIEHLRGKHLLLVVDNCEHVIEDTASLIDSILRSCPGITLLATSREPLRISGETVWRVPPLTVPDPAARMDLHELAQCEAIDLFLDRAQKAALGFELTADNAPAVAQLCRRLDGIPLAIELAAARAGLLSPEQILDRLQDRFGLLTHGTRSGPARHRTLHAALDWSYDLLNDSERMLFRRLSMFAGSFSLVAIEDICSTDGLEVDTIADLLGTLLEKSLVIAGGEAGAPIRFRMLETVREYGRERLEESGEVERLGRRHCDYFVALAEEGYSKLRGVEQQVWHQRLAEDLSNLRSAFNWSCVCQPAASLRLAWGLTDFWILHGMVPEGDGWFEQALAGHAALDELRAKTLAEAGFLAWHRDDVARASARWQECLGIYRELGDKRGIGQALHQVSYPAQWQGDFGTARHNLEDGLAMSREAGDAFWIAGSLRALAQLDLLEGAPDQARVLLEESLTWNEPIGDPKWRRYSVFALALCDIERGDFVGARSQLEDALAISRELEFALGLAGDLLGFAALAAAQSQPTRALHLAGASESLAESISVDPLRLVKALIQRWLEKSRRDLGRERAAECLAEGRAMTQERAIEYALEAHS